MENPLHRRLLLCRTIRQLPNILSARFIFSAVGADTDIAGLACGFQFLGEIIHPAAHDGLIIVHLVAVMQEQNNSETGQSDSGANEAAEAAVRHYTAAAANRF